MLYHVSCIIPSPEMNPSSSKKAKIMSRWLNGIYCFLNNFCGDINITFYRYWAASYLVEKILHFYQPHEGGAIFFPPYRKSLITLILKPTLRVRKIAFGIKWNCARYFRHKEHKKITVGLIRDKIAQSPITGGNFRKPRPSIKITRANLTYPKHSKKHSQLSSPFALVG